MLLRDYLVAVAEGYDYHDGFDTAQQRLLARASTELQDYGPADFVIKASGGQPPLGATLTPWIGFFDPDESVTPMDGLYVVWILDATGQNWTLRLNMGTEKRGQNVPAAYQAGTGSGKEQQLLAALRAEADAIRGALPHRIAEAWDSAVALHSTARRQRRYEAATILAQSYPVSNLPSDSILEADLRSMCIALQEAAQVKRRLAILAPGTISTSSSTLADSSARELVFDPGVDKVSTKLLPERSITRTPRHEDGLRRYGLWLQSRGFSPATNVHPRDFIIPGTPEWLGEYKVVYGSNVARATREAHSQLKEYRHFIYPRTNPRPGMVAVFSDSVTDERVTWLNAEGIAVVWNRDHEWHGCAIARKAGLGS
ncbi:DUF3578 domain-containing protein [Actinoplanes sp. NBRC 101535]|uniref:MrcB family domain-containing protein n=1 Tax=Actinoplanes sp. NBRC 101535 TaxID=3032196 RepID=UPI0024A4134E|nr:DUF3578 domain-containing protein [Actinoplanes sp. NBRC 101535]GLY05123.1 hypothetical protein Acsp01_55020 [Actinoplanes sp. NBRC 101535]